MDKSDNLSQQEIYANLLEILKYPKGLSAKKLCALQLLLKQVDILPEINITRTNTLVFVVDELITNDQTNQISKVLDNPLKLISYLWYKKTEHHLLIRPKTILDRRKNHMTQLVGWNNFKYTQEEINQAYIELKEKIKLKYSRKECRLFATVINQFKNDVNTICELMHPNRQMWVRIIRALRLVEYSKKKGFENLAAILDCFHNKNYSVWAEKVLHAKATNDTNKLFILLKERPNEFAKQFFTLLIRLDSKLVSKHFMEIKELVSYNHMDTLRSNIENYFSIPAYREAKLPESGLWLIKPNTALIKYTNEDLENFKAIAKSVLN